MKANTDISFSSATPTPTGPASYTGAGAHVQAAGVLVGAGALAALLL